MKSKTLRFEILKRDDFKCQYCGKSAPEVVLEVDHIIPKSKGGLTVPENLLASCFDCNRGKRDRSIGDNGIDKCKFERIEEKSKKLKKIFAKHKREKALKRKKAEELIEYYMSFGSPFSPADFDRKIITLLGKIDYDEIKEAIDITFSKTRYGYLKYFFGICWTKVRNLEQEKAILEASEENQ